MDKSGIIFHGLDNGDLHYIAAEWCLVQYLKDPKNTTVLVFDGELLWERIETMSKSISGQIEVLDLAGGNGAKRIRMEDKMACSGSGIFLIPVGDDHKNAMGMILGFKNRNVVAVFEDASAIDGGFVESAVANLSCNPKFVMLELQSSAG